MAWWNRAAPGELTRAERSVGLMILAGKTYKEIAHARGTSASTVRVLAHRIMVKLGAAGRTGLAEKLAAVLP